MQKKTNGAARWRGLTSGARPADAVALFGNGVTCFSLRADDLPFRGVGHGPEALRQVQAGALDAPEDLQGVLPTRFEVFGHSQIDIRIHCLHKKELWLSPAAMERSGIAVMCMSLLGPDVGMVRRHGAQLSPETWGTAG